MDFFAAQDLARRNTRRLLVLFALAVLALIALTNLAIMLALWALDDGTFGTWNYVVESPALEGATPPGGFLAYASLPLLLGSGALITLAVLLASALRHVQLRRGGRAIAEMLDGRALEQHSTQEAERRLLNVVEEVAIASGVPVPVVYVVPGEGINAFAAGHAAEDAVIGVTEGALARLGRDELQGVIGHEFSHLLNGDMRLNMRLIAVLYGILFIAHAGRLLLRVEGGGSSRNRDRGGGVIVMLGIALLLIGSGGVMFGRLIKAGVSREREYLADASSVQFTRNPLGLAGALRKIGGLGQHGEVASAAAEEASHLFFSQAIRARVGSLFATHPPLGERIRRIDPAWNGAFAGQAELDEAPADPVPGVSSLAAASRLHEGVAAQPEQATAPGPIVETAIAGLTAEVLAACRDSTTAPLAVLGCLIDANTEMAARQRELLQAHGFLPAAELAGLLREAPLVQVLELALPALRQLDEATSKRLWRAVQELIVLDGHLALDELLTAALLERHLFPPARPVQATRARYAKLEQVAAPLSVLLSALALATPGDSERQFGAAQDIAGATGLRLLRDSPPDWPAVRAALAQLRGLFPLQKPRVLKACRAALQAGLVDAGRLDTLFGLLANALDCPAQSLSASADTLHPVPSTRAKA